MAPSGLHHYLLFYKVHYHCLVLYFLCTDKFMYLDTYNNYSIFELFLFYFKKFKKYFKWKNNNCNYEAKYDVLIFITLYGDLMKPININLCLHIFVQKTSQSHRNNGFPMWIWGGRKGEVKLDVDHRLQSGSWIWRLLQHFTECRWPKLKIMWISNLLKNWVFKTSIVLKTF